MKHITILLILFCAYLSSAQTTIGGSGVCHVKSHPNTIFDLRAPSEIQDCRFAVNVQTGLYYMYIDSLTYGQRWVLMDSIFNQSTAGAEILNELTDVSLSSPTNGQVLKYNGSAWVNDTDATGGGAVFSTNGSDAYYDSGNVGIGNNAPATDLDVTGEARASDYFNGTLTNTDNPKIVKIKLPKGGSYQGVGSVTGSLKIKLPVTYNSYIVHLKIDVFHYSQGKSFTLYASGYLNGAGNSWANVSANIITSGDADHDVRFGDDGSAACIWIGETSDIWSYPRVVVDDAMISFINSTQDVAPATWDSDWGVTVETSFGTIKQTVTSTLTSANQFWIDNPSGINNTNANNVGIGLTSPLVKFHVNGDSRVDGSFAVNRVAAVGYTMSLQNISGRSPLAIYSSSGSPRLAVGLVSDVTNLDLYDTNSAVQTRITAAGNSYFLNGNVGLNVSSPTQLLDVNGAVRFRAGLYDNNNSIGTNGYILKATGSGFQWVDPTTITTAAQTMGGDLSGSTANAQIVSGAVGAAEIASTAVTAGTYGSTTTIPVFSVDGDGRLTSASSVAFTSNLWTLSGSDIYRNSKVAIGSTSIGTVGQLQVNAGANVYASLFTGTSTQTYTVYQNSSTGATGSDGMIVGMNGLNGNINTRETGGLNFGVNNITQLNITQTDLALYQDTKITGTSTGTTDEALLVENAAGADILEVDNDGNTTHHGPQLQKNGFDGYGGSHTSSFVYERENAGTIQTSQAESSDYIHIIFDLTLTTSESAFQVGINGCMPTATAGTVQPLSVLTFARLTDAGLVAASNTLSSGQTLQWYVHSTLNRPVLRLGNAANHVGKTTAIIRTIAGYNSAGAPPIYDVQINDTATL